MFSWSGDEIPESLIRRLTDRLTVKSFCGVKFGEVKEGIGPCCGQGGALLNRFRLFDSYSVYGTRSHRVNRVEIRTNSDLSEKTTESLRQEVETVVSLLEKKYGVQFVKRRRAEGYFGYEAESGVARIEFRGRTTGEPNMSISFQSKEVDEQESAMERRRQKKAIELPKGEGLDVL